MVDFLEIPNRNYVVLGCSPLLYEKMIDPLLNCFYRASCKSPWVSFPRRPESSNCSDFRTPASAGVTEIGSSARGSIECRGFGEPYLKTAFKLILQPLQKDDGPDHAHPDAGAPCSQVAPSESLQSPMARLPASRRAIPRRP